MPHRSPCPALHNVIFSRGNISRDWGRDGDDNRTHFLHLLFSSCKANTHFHFHISEDPGCKKICCFIFSAVIVVVFAAAPSTYSAQHFCRMVHSVPSPHMKGSPVSARHPHPVNRFQIFYTPKSAVRVLPPDTPFKAKRPSDFTGNHTRSKGRERGYRRRAALVVSKQQQTAAVVLDHS